MNKNDSIFQMSYDNVLDDIIPGGISTDWLYKTVYCSENPSAALRDIMSPIDDEITYDCFLMNLGLTYGSPDNKAIEPGQVIAIDTGFDEFPLFIVDSLVGTITITAGQRYEKGFLIQKASIDQNGKAYYMDVNHAYLIGFRDRDRDEFECVGLITGEPYPAQGFELVKDLETSDEVEESIHKGIQGTVDKMVAGIPDMINSIFTQIHFFKSFIEAMSDEALSTEVAHMAVQDQLRSLKEDLELFMVALSECDTLKE